MTVEVERYYKIGELAKLANLNARTIDYYTKIGLITEKKRSQKNYRLYNDETLKQLQRIESMKQNKYSLAEIKLAFKDSNKLQSEEVLLSKLNELQAHLKQIEQEVKEISPVINQLKPQQAKQAFHLLTPQTAACIEALLLLLGKGPIM